MKVVCLDLETTGTSTNGRDEILQISMIDGKKNILMNEYVKPIDHKEWPEAEAVNHISPKDVENSKTILELKDDIMKIINNADVLIGYNSNNYDIPFLENALGVSLKNKIKYDVMIEFKKNFTLYEVHNFKLIEAGDCFGIKNIEAHNALGDVYETVDLYWRMQEEMKKPRLDTIYKMSDGREFLGEEFAKLYIKEHKDVKIDKKLYIIDGKVVPEGKVKDLSKYWTAHDFIKPGLYITDAKATAQVKKVEKKAAKAVQASQSTPEKANTTNLPTIKKR